MRREALLLGCLLAAVPVLAQAKVVDAQPGGFEVQQHVDIKAPARQVYDRLIQPARWWSSEHTYTGSAANLSFSDKAGGCWCETLRGETVRHMTVVHADAGKLIVLEGALGPLVNTGATGHLNWTLIEKAGVTTVVWTYDVGGYAKGGLDKLAAPVDGVLAEQLGRLKSLVETGKPG